MSAPLNGEEADQIIVWTTAKRIGGELSENVQRKSRKMLCKREEKEVRVRGRE